MSDPRFARLKTDPRFRRPKRKEQKLVVDERFKTLFDDGQKQGKRGKKGRRVDKYGRPIADDHEQDNLRRFYRLENDDEDEESGLKRPDYARGEGLVESSSEEEEDAAQEDSESDEDGIVTLGQDQSKPIRILQDDVEAEIDLDEDNFADLDAQAAAYSKAHPKKDMGPEVSPTRRLAVVNLDWDHVRAVHLYKIFSSLVSPTALPDTSRKGSKKNVVRGKVLSVRVYPSQFGKERMEREEKEGPPPEVFKLKSAEDDDEITAKDIIEVGDGNDYDEDALRKYQLERLRYYYAIVDFDTVQAASHVYAELEGTELEYSANVFDLSYVPGDMVFEEEPRDEATEDLDPNYKGLDFVTDALRHSKVKLTWDEDDPERNRITRRTLSRKEIEEADFKAYVASSSSESESEMSKVKDKKAGERDKLRALLLQGNDDALPEGWGAEGGDKDDSIDMEITFMPGLSEAQDGDQEETTLEKYQRKMKEKKKKRKEEMKEKGKEKVAKNEVEDEFFDDGDDESAGEAEEPKSSKRKDKTEASEQPSEHSTAEELALLASSDHPDREAKHFDMKAVLKAEKSKGRKKKGKKGAAQEEDNELQEEFKIDVKDERFKALHEDHTFAIDPSNPHFKKTKNMSALLEERSKRQKDRRLEDPAIDKSEGAGEKNLKSLVESVKRKSIAVPGGGVGKRRKL